MEQTILQPCRSRGKKPTQIIEILGHKMVLNPPEGMCPHGEAKCDNLCFEYHGCRINRRGLHWPDIFYFTAKAKPDGTNAASEKGR